MTKVFLALLIWVSISHAKSDSPLIVERVISVYDGDTFRVDIAGLHPLIGKNIGIRVAGVDTPEIRGECDFEKQLARKAKAHTKNLIENASVIELRSPKRGKYFRIVADVWVDGKSLSESLILARMAYAYEGKKKQSWCNEQKEI